MKEEMLPNATSATNATKLEEKERLKRQQHIKKEKYSFINWKELIKRGLKVVHERKH